MLQVSIDRNYFKKALNDYADYRFSLIREICQNSIDAKSTEISFSVESQNDSIKLVATNNGTPMDYDTIVNKLMSVGGTTKTGSGEDGNVGGFGVASVIIYMAHRSYTIRSGDWIVNGEGGAFEVIKAEEHYPGTQSEIILDSDATSADSDARQLHRQINKFASLAQWNGTFHVSYAGETNNLPCTLHKGYFRREFSFGRLYTNRQHNNLLVFRINGVPMFTKIIQFDGCAIFEATHSSQQLMTSNRDGLKYLYQSEIEDVIRRFSGNLSSVLNREPTYEIFGNTLVGVDKEDVPAPEIAVSNTESPQPVEETDEDAELDNYFEKQDATYAAYTSFPDADLQYNASAKTHDDDHRPVCDDYSPATNKKFTQQYMILNESGMTTPESTKPETMSKYCQRLLQIWIRLIHTTYRVNEVTGHFAVGFCLGDAVAKYVRRDGIDYYLINPFEIVRQSESSSRSFKRKYHLVKHREDLIMSAIHEFIHGAYRHNYHDEQFSSILTDKAAGALRHAKRYKQCFR